MENKKLIDLAREVSLKSYSPYSNFKVGAALEMKSGKVYVGTNVENASFGATICAERGAVMSAISAGERGEDFEKIAIYSNGSLPYPCGICRQVLCEFNPSIKVVVANEKENKEFLLSDIFSGVFKL